jgi:ketosteroid isomerase-like protein
MPKNVVTQYFQALNDDDLDGVLALFDPEVELHAPVDFHARGVEAAARFYRMLPAIYPEHLDLPVEIIAEGNQAAVFIDFRGTTEDGIFVEFKAIDWFVVKDGKIEKLTICFDSQFTARLLGQSPAYNRLRASWQKEGTKG